MVWGGDGLAADGEGSVPGADYGVAGWEGEGQCPEVKVDVAVIGWTT
jgi:hypothetical protein